METVDSSFQKEKLHPLQVEYHWYQAHQEELVSRFKNRFLVIAGKKIIGDYSNFADAYTDAVKNHKPGTFLIQHCLAKSDERPIRIPGRKIITFEDLKNE